MEALSVSTSARDSPGDILFPALHNHFPIVPMVMVGDKAGIGTTIWFGKDEKPRKNDPACRFKIVFVRIDIWSMIQNYYSKYLNQRNIKTTKQQWLHLIMHSLMH